MPINPLRLGLTAPQAVGVDGSGFNNLSGGNKAYGLGGRPMPNIGRTGMTPGYAQRDATQQNRQDALQRRLGGLTSG